MDDWNNQFNDTFTMIIHYYNFIVCYSSLNQRLLRFRPAVQGQVCVTDTHWRGVRRAVSVWGHDSGDS